MKKIRLGIVMAGAVSAGAYTAGVIDYLLETLERWEKAKKENKRKGKSHKDYDHSLPMHDVVIDIIGGASAGGMTATIATLALFKGNTPVTERNPPKGANLVYDAWVNLNDNDSANTIKQLFATDDLNDPSGVKVPSLLNAKAIRSIGQTAVKTLEEQLLEDTPESTDKTLPPYISPEMEVILSLCSIRGIPVDMKFETGNYQEAQHVKRQKMHRMWIHKWNAHFKLTDKPEEYKSGHTLPFHPNSRVQLSNFLGCAIASGAFPLGLSAMKVDAAAKDEFDGEIISPPPTSYLNEQILRLFKGNENVTPELSNVSDEFSSTIVDGGVVNNEPFGEVERALMEKADASNAPHALLMIDPFPSHDGEEEKAYTHPLSIEKLVLPLFSAVRRQAMVKESDIPKFFSKNAARSLIIPVNSDNKDYPIACGSLGGFGGFFSKEFREHDFFLGRKNCQSFLRKYFSIEANPPEDCEDLLDDIYADVNKEIFLRFAFSDEELNEADFDSQDKQKEIRYPIIPDTLLAKASSKNKAYWDKETKTDKIASIPKELKDPKLDINSLKDLQKPLLNRTSNIINSYLPGGRSKRKPKKTDKYFKVDVTEQEHKKEVKAIYLTHFSRPILRFSLLYFWLPLLGAIIISTLGIARGFKTDMTLFEGILSILVGIILPFAVVFYFYVILKKAIIFAIAKKILLNIISDFKKRGLLKEKR